jgi:hypothetical protein
MLCPLGLLEGSLLGPSLLPPELDLTFSGTPLLDSCPLDPSEESSLLTLSTLPLPELESVALAADGD